jgi:hypothetical protein
MPANVDGMVQAGVREFRSGRKEEARTLLMRAVEIDQYNEQAWLWLSAVVETVEEQRTCLENVITINPSNERARQGLQSLSQKSGSVSAQSASQASDDVLANTSFTGPSTPGGDLFGGSDDEELPASLGLDSPAIPTSSPSSNQRVNEPSSAEYDNWVSNLNLSGSSESTRQQDAQKFMSAPVDEDDEVFDINSALGLSDNGDDPFGSGPFSAPAAPVASPRKEQASSKMQSPSPTSRTSPKTTDPLLDGMEDEDIDDSAFVDDFGDDHIDQLEASEFFRYIPKEIAATRLPGTSERYPILVMLGLLVMIALNIGAVAFLVMKMTSG